MSQSEQSSQGNTPSTRPLGTAVTLVGATVLMVNGVMLIAGEGSNAVTLIGIAIAVTGTILRRS